ncbi:molybdenum cofactor biosynthesis protein MoaE [Crateriforma conspicua]|uniref:Molybdopterin synthase catalytic subunit n=1 Tax=Crateriforma conspicua TaxID=2527996 RepID=A0A5C5Y5V9_9PLAN|nr:molybdenum cofactor biosynthesis protein MoaE [Crateriforma conspicua]TWT70103.1 Molybdopterin synthase catalytic subunit [Crateriforma conspicua]
MVDQANSSPTQSDHRSTEIHVALTDDPIATQQWMNRLGDPDVGAHAWFIGVTRGQTKASDQNDDDKTTLTLFYQAQRTMAVAEMRRLAQAAVEQFGLRGFVLVHRLGEVPVGQASVLLGCCSPHRRGSLDALPWVMDQLKKTVPIWKQEHYTDGVTEWVHPES